MENQELVASDAIGPSVGPRHGQLLAGGAIDAVIADVVERVAAAVVARLTKPSGTDTDEWFDSRRAAEYLGIHRDTLRKLAAERALPSEQDGPGCKLFFRRSDLDLWRRSGGRAAHLSALADAA